MTEVASKPESTEKLKESAAQLVDALTLLAQGKRNMVCGEVPQACNQLQEACRLLAKKYGETANECGEAYLCYGKALLDLSRMESGVLGNALQGIEDEDDESEDKSSEGSDQVENPEKTPAEEREKISDQVIDAMLETDDELKKRIGKDDKKEEKVEANGETKKETNGESKEQTNGTEKEAKSEIQVNGEDASAKVEDEEKMETDEKKEAESEDLNTEEEGETEEEEGEEGEAKDTEEEGETKEGEEGETIEGEEGETKEGEEGKEEKEKKKDDEDDVTNLQLAWEMLELAKIIYKREDTKVNKLKLAEAFLKLGEVGLETEQYDQSIADFNECLKIQKSVLEVNDRYLAETQYQLGVANTYACKYQAAIDNYKAAAEVIKLKLESLNKVVEEQEKESKGKAPAEADDPIVKTRKEIGELKDILPDIMQKIDDVIEERKSADVAKALIKDTVASLTPGASKAFESCSSTSEGTSKSDASMSNASKSGASKSGASDITHLVRKKRKSDEGKEVRDDAKKSKIDGSGDA